MNGLTENVREVVGGLERERDAGNEKKSWRKRGYSEVSGMTRGKRKMERG